MTIFIKIEQEEQKQHGNMIHLATQSARFFSHIRELLTAIRFDNVERDLHEYDIRVKVNELLQSFKGSYVIFFLGAI